MLTGNEEPSTIKHQLSTKKWKPTHTTCTKQLKSSGNLRIMKTNVVQKITDYDRLIKYVAIEYAFSRTEYETMNQLRLKIFDFFFAIKFYPDIGLHISADSIFKLNPPLLNDDPKLMKEFANWVQSSSIFYQLHVINFLVPLNKSATESIALLQKEYDLKNE